VAGGKVEPFAGDLDDYAAWLRTRHRDGDESRMPADTREAPAAAASRQTSSASGSGRSKVNPYKLQKAEEKVARLEHQLAECEAQLMDPAIYADADRVAGLSRQRHQLRAELDAAEAELLELYAT
jgi:ATP-binding cassette subfamily F protein 3